MRSTRTKFGKFNRKEAEYAEGAHNWVGLTLLGSAGRPDGPTRSTRGSAVICVAKAKGKIVDPQNTETIFNCSPKATPNIFLEKAKNVMAGAHTFPTLSFFWQRIALRTARPEKNPSHAACSQAGTFTNNSLPFEVLFTAQSKCH